MPALERLRVLEFGHYIAAPHCTQILADQGADVVKVEPVTGEPSRRSQPLSESGESLYFAAHNRGKRSVSLDLKGDDGRAAMDRMLAWADVLVTNYSAGVPERLGFGWEHAHAVNPRLVMVHITGFGLSGPLRDRLAYDGVVQAMSGMADMTGPADGPPMVPGLFVADHTAALQAAIAVLVGVAGRDRTGTGELVDLAMYDAILPLLAHHLPASALGAQPRRNGNTLPSALSNLFPAADGWVYLAPVSDTMWRRLCEAMAVPEWLDEPRFRTPRDRVANREVIEGAIARWTSRLPKDEVVETLQSHGVACGPLQTVGDVVADQHLRERGMVDIVRLPETGTIPVPGAVVNVGRGADGESSPPALGADTSEFLAEIGAAEAVRTARSRTGAEVR